SMPSRSRRVAPATEYKLSHERHTAGNSRSQLNPRPASATASATRLACNNGEDEAKGAGIAFAPCETMTDLSFAELEFIVGGGQPATPSADNRSGEHVTGGAHPGASTLWYYGPITKKGTSACFDMNGEPEDLCYGVYTSPYRL